jgi:hypothetical protein
MPKTCYREINFKPKSLALIETANAIIEEYSAQGFELTLRQLYYQFVARDVIPNTQKSYDNLGSLINDARLAGLVDWLAIVDRTRSMRKNSHWASPSEIVESCARQFQIDKWEGQEYRPEVWVEKDALVGVVERICSSLDVPYFSCRGYTSQSEMWVAAQRLLQWREAGQTPIIIHLGDHDPSGIDMSRDIEDRLALFMDGDAPEFRRIALNKDQVNRYKPPPNPAKLTDSRCRGYIQIHGDKSWELDALDPKVISALIDGAIDGIRQDEVYEERAKLELEHRAALRKVAKGMK